MLYDKTLVRWELPRYVEKEKVLFYKMLMERWRKKVYKNAPGSLQFSYNNLTRATTLLWNGTGLDLMFVYSGISCLATTTGDETPWRVGLLWTNGPCGTSTGRRNEGFMDLHALL